MMTATAHEVREITRKVLQKNEDIVKEVDKIICQCIATAGTGFSSLLIPRLLDSRVIFLLQYKQFKVYTYDACTKISW